MIHSSLEPLNEKFRQLCQVEGGGSEKSWKAISIFKEQPKLAPKLCSSIAWESGRPIQPRMPHMARCVHRSVMHTLFTCMHTQKNTMSSYHRAAYRGVEGLSCGLPAVLLVGTAQFHLPGYQWALSGLNTV